MNNKEYDLVIVGAGNAALSAALAARENGVQVLVLEKAPKHKRGGNSYFTDGAIRFAYNDLQDIRAIMPELSDEEAATIIMPEYSQEHYYEDLMRVTADQSDSGLARHLVGKSYETIRWMKEQGVKFELNYGNQSFEKDGKRQFWGGLPVKTENRGIGLMGQLFRRVEELGIDIWYESTAKKLGVENGVISSVLVSKRGEEVEVSTSGVVLACGSFEANEEMRIKHLGEEWGAAIVRGTEYNTGDGIEMALEVGAQPYGQWSGCHSIGTDSQAPVVGDYEKPGDIFKKHSYPLSIMLNKDGQRFVDEGADFRNYTYAKYGREILKQPDHLAYQIYDAKVRGLLRDEYDREEATSSQADSLEELVNQLPVDKEAFLKTIDEYNQAVQEGEFNPTIKDGKSTKGMTPAKTNWALPIDQGPFYAFPVTCGITFTFGGIHVNTKGQALNENDEPIPGLFAAGEMVGGIFYENYPGGSGLMSGSVFGKTAGNSAARYSKEKAKRSLSL
ncbi:FAD-dependent tricarballylate dehydrogenase TcuA [Radiobacillus kanasensis]|uniref:FAD-dependent tricarballylate dehydrogenase TcuA n=1 Tax=Radiobacillus kanasensis TaxID=2844358 RepID=UPI001E44F934|nr:FAD-dependent tricarballylate dehydrogenase TcuA [Radiobacillus kanasensis]UFU00794.1 FAD-dependent tricarballylate dehydrogenase TcuA [Radiobacillus kanasensis]